MIEPMIAIGIIPTARGPQIHVEGPALGDKLMALGILEAAKLAVMAPPKPPTDGPRIMPASGPVPPIH